MNPILPFVNPVCGLRAANSSIEIGGEQNKIITDLFFLLIVSKNCIHGLESHVKEVIPTQAEVMRSQEMLVRDRAAEKPDIISL